MPRHTTENGLTAKEAMFVAAYVAGENGEFGNATKAALKAGYSERTAGRIGSEIVHKPRIKAAIAEALKAQEVRTLITADANLRAIERLAVKAEQMGELAPAIRARELIGKHYKSFTDKLEVQDTTPRAERLRAARERKKQAVSE